MSVQIIIDSTTDLPERYLKKVKVVPLTIRFGEEEYSDGVTISKEEFYRKLIETDEMPATSQATPFAFEPFFEEVKKKGDSAVVITLARKFSGTYQSACLAAEEYDNIFVVDSASVAIGAGILVEYAIELAEQGMDAGSIASLLEEKKKGICIVALLDTLEYLKKGGRISKAAALAGGVLNIKPVVSVEDGEIIVIGKARGSRQGNNLLVTRINEMGGADYGMPVLLGYTGLSELLLLKYIEDSKELWEGKVEPLEYSLVGSTIGTHAGPGAIAVAFFKNEEQ